MDKKQLFCITYAGGTAKFFDVLEKELADCYEVHALEYSGHGSRRNEPFYDNCESMFMDIAEQIRLLRKDVPYEIFGYSMGSLVAYEVAAHYMGADQPGKIFVAAHEPPNIDSKGKYFAALNEEEFLEKMIEFGGIDERLVGNKRFLKIFFGPLRADYQYIMEYQCREQIDRINCDIVVFYSEKDTRRVDMLKWDQFTCADIILYELEGNHFFLKNQEKIIAHYMKQ